MPGSAPNAGIVTEFLHTFDSFINSGFGLIAGDVHFLISFVIVLSLTLAGLFWALSENGDVLAPFLRKVLIIGFFAFLVNQWQPITQTFMDSFVQLGLKAGGNTISPAVFFDPGQIAQKGLDIWHKIAGQISQLSGPIDTFNNMGAILALGLAGVLSIIAFFIISIQVLITIIEFKLVTLAAFVLVPFGIWGKTSFLAERALGYVVSAGLKFMTLAIVVSLGYAVISQIDPGTAPDVNRALAVALGALILLALALMAPSLASSLVTGGPSLGAGGMMAAGIGAGAGALAVSGAGLAAAKGGTNVGLQAGKLGIGATRAGASLGMAAATGGASLAASAGSAIASGVAKAGAGAAKSGASAAGSAAKSGASAASAGAKGAGGAAKGAASATSGAAKSGASSAGKAGGQAVAEGGRGAGKVGGAASSATNQGGSRFNKGQPNQGKKGGGSRFQQAQQAASSLQGGDDSGGISSTGMDSED